MIKFTDIFDTLENDELILKITQKYSGDDEMIPFYYYDIIRKADSATVGKISVRIGNNFHSYYNGHIGYEIFKEYRGNRYAYKASIMVLDVARFHGMGFIYLTCDESNTASYRTIEKLGAELVEICDVPREYFGWFEGMEKQRVYKLRL
ncbi:MAG: GNAT family N-acetyltransferase [Acutalibacteraceae bacterium]